MTTTQTGQALLLPVGQFFGTFHPVAGSTERYHRVRLGDEVWELDDQRFTLWALAHGAGDRPAEEPWTLPAVRDAAAARLPGVDSAPLLHGLLAEGLAVEVAPAEAVEFARRHRVGARMLGLGNSAEQPWLWSIGFFEHPVVSVTRTVYDMWERCPSGESLWTMCQALAEEEREAGGTEPDLVDPERLLTAFLGTAHLLLAASVVYLEPLP
ncbi:hypothetical protein ACSNOB_00850 [Micromonospora sp. URMC 106]|uniref:hypothetical protein n=1 Tax=Micromonospora sp. URMC 106 TaxID=3423408 RepID=UPI003F1ACF2D